MARENKIHVGFGFHVNCYHSYRGDTNDGLGFGSDIRIIRKTIDVLNMLNAEGIPVKGTWDTENFFSLEKILPEFAPDIIEGMKERVEKHGDENIIMGYSNGALSAMTEDEFVASIELAVTNPEGSGLKDIFGTCEMIVRPQEVMFTPSQVSLYNRCGVKALCLYYSCVPFDAFRTIVPLLPDEQAFNPLTYTYKGESMTILPTYNNSDICDAGCLRNWVQELRREQLDGKINRDLFVFINMDADAIFWESMNLPIVGSRIANTDGINGLVREIADLDYVVFSTPGTYLADHEPVGTADFTQDTADGNFTGYASWSEKPYNRKIWTHLERARAQAAVNSEKDCLSPSFKDRVLLLSTTHFGLATPVLNIQREKKADELAESVTALERNALPKAKKLTIENTNGTALQCVQLQLNCPCVDASEIILSGDGLEDYTVIPTDDEGGVFAVMKFRKVKKAYSPAVSFDGTGKEAEKTLSLETGKLKMSFSPVFGIDEVICCGEKIGSSDFLSSFITYAGKKYPFSVGKVRSISCAGSGKGVSVEGSIHLPGELSGGKFSYLFFTVPFSDMIFVRSSVSYPYTPENKSISTENSTLGRFTDTNWTEAVPFEITARLGDNLRVLKRNFMDDISSYRVDTFRESDPLNSYLASFNHQLTGGFTGLSGDKATLLVANSRQVLNSMAHCPMRLEKDGTVRMNPFGTYYGPQRHHSGRAKDEILATYTLVTPQGKSIAPSYDGVTETSVMALCGAEAKLPDDGIPAEVCAFSDGAVVIAPDGSPLLPFSRDNVSFRKAVETGETGEKLMNPVFSGISGNIIKYVTRGSRAISHIIFNQIKAKRRIV